MSYIKHFTLISLALAAQITAASPTGTIYTANEREGSISQVPLDRGTPHTIKVAVAPHNVQVSPDGRWLLVVGMPQHAGHKGHSLGTGQLLVFRTDTLTEPEFLLPAGKHPAHVVTDLAGKRAFVTDSASDLVRVFDLGLRQEVGQVSTGRFPHGLRLSPDGNTLYVADLKADAVSVIDVATLKETARIPVGKAPAQVGFAPDGKQAYVSLSGENKLGVINTVTRRLVAKIAVGRMPIQMYSTPDGKQVYVANQGSAKLPDKRVSVIDPVARKVVATIDSGKGAHGVVVSHDGAYAFVSNLEDGTFSIIDTATRQVVARPQVGAGPNGISFQQP